MLARNTDTGGWVVINTHPHRENLAIENLTRQKFLAYCPQMIKRVTHARRSQDVLRPLFPGYVFVQVHAEAQRWRSILSTFGVRSLVTCGDHLSYLDPDFIQSLKAREVDGAIVRPEQPYKIGQQVRIAGGAFDGFVATILALNDKDRLMVLLQMLNQSVKVKVNSANVVAM
jgi:transcriptional antiterminator RfaH